MLDRKALLIVAVMTAHSAAEGIGVGVSYGGGKDLGAILVPRGARVRAAAGWSIFSSLPQPLIAPAAFICVEQFRPLLPAGLGFAAGAMVWMVWSELLPDLRLPDALGRRAQSG